MKLLLVTILLTLSLDSLSQNCKLVERTSKKSSKTKSRGKLVATIDFQSFMIEKHFDPDSPNDSLNFSVMIIMGSRYELSDSVTNSSGSFIFDMSNGETVVLTGATASNVGNALMGAPNTIMFRVEGTSEQFRPLSQHMIHKLEVFNIVKTSFKSKIQKQINTVVSCLLNE